MEDLKPGRKLDALVAEKVMGNPPPVVAPGEWPQALHEWEDRMPCYSTDISAAFEIERVLSEQGWYLDLIRISGGWRANFRKWLPPGDPKGSWLVVSAFGHSDHPDTDPDKAGSRFAPHAICLAALKAIEA